MARPDITSRSGVRFSDFPNDNQCIRIIKESAVGSSSLIRRDDLQPRVAGLINVARIGQEEKGRNDESGSRLDIATAEIHMVTILIPLHYAELSYGSTYRLAMVTNSVTWETQEVTKLTDHLVA